MTTARSRKFSWDQRLARALVRPFAGTRLAPNHITLFSLASGVAGSVFLAFGGDAVYPGGVLYAVALLADHMDGELARMSGKTSVWGHYFDYITGGVIHAALFVGIGIGSREPGAGEGLLLAGLIAGVSVGLIFLLRDEMDRRFGKDAVAQPHWAGFDIEDVMYLVVPVVWAGAAKPFLIVAAVGAPAFLLWQLFDFFRLKKARG